MLIERLTCMLLFLGITGSSVDAATYTVDGTTDSDGDGVSDLDEYRCGTDPHDPGSALQLAVPTNATPSTFTLAWPVSAGRRYQVRATADFLLDPWPVVAGPWEAAAGQSLMQWTDPTEGAGSNRFYRIQMATP